MNELPMGEYPAKRRENSTISLFDPDYVILAELVPMLERLAADKPAKVLDFGAGNTPYRGLFGNSTYVAADVEQNRMGDIDLILRDTPLPLDDDSVDLILCIYVLEHIQCHSTILREFRRVLRPGGRLFVVTPFIHREHEAPHDFHRPTIFSLAAGLEQVGETEIRKVGNGWFALYSLANEMHIKQGERPHASPIGRAIRAAFNRLLLPVLNRTLFRIAASKNDAIYHSLFAVSTKKTSVV